jgi:hypothetical protein
MTPLAAATAALAVFSAGLWGFYLGYVRGLRMGYQRLRCGYGCLRPDRLRTHPEDCQ